MLVLWRERRRWCQDHWCKDAARCTVQVLPNESHVGLHVDMSVWSTPTQAVVGRVLGTREGRHTHFALFNRENDITCAVRTCY